MRSLLLALLLAPALAFGQSAEVNLSFLANSLLTGGIVPLTNGGLGAAIPTPISGECLGFNGNFVWLTCSGGSSGSFSALSGGTNTTAAMVVGSGASLSYSGSGSINANAITGTSVTGVTGSGNVVLATAPTVTALTISGISGSTQCLQVNSSGVVSGVGSGCATTFATVGAGTNTTAAMLVGTGASLGPTGSGTVNANQFNGAGVTASQPCLGSNSSGQLISGTCSGGVSSVSGSAAVTVSPTSGATVVSLTAQSNNTTLCNASGSSAAPTACTPAVELGVLASGTPNAQVGTTYTLLLTDANSTVTMANASANTLTVPTNASVAFSVGTVITVQELGAGFTTVSPAAGVTFQSSQFGSSSTQGYPLGGIYGSLQLQKAATNTWTVIGYQPGPGSFALSGTCTTLTSQAGTALAGVGTMAGAGNCTVIVTPSGVLPAAHGFTGTMHDRTQPALPAWGESSTSTTAITFTLPTAVATSDVIAFGPLSAY